MPLYGQVGGAVGDQLLQMLEQQVREQLAREELAQRARRDEEGVRQFNEQLGLQRQQFEAAEAERGERNRRQRVSDNIQSDQRGVRRMMGEVLTRKQGPITPDDRRSLAMLQVEAGGDIDPRLLAEPEPPKRTVVTTIGRRGEPIKRAVGDEELAAGVPEYREPRAPVDDRLVQIMGPQGTPIWVREADAVGKPAAQAPRAVTGSERQVLAYYNRAKQASDDIGSMEEQIAKSGLGSQLQQQYAPNVLQTEGQQRYRQAQRAFTEARLRKESGAAIPAGEYENDAKTYFAQPGDSPQVIEQKRRARQTVLDGLKFSAGKAFNEFYGDEPPPQGGEGGAPVQYRFNPKTGKVEPVK